MEQEKLYIRAEMDITRFTEAMYTVTCSEDATEYLETWNKNNPNDAAADVAGEAAKFCAAYPNNWEAALKAARAQNNYPK